MHKSDAKAKDEPALFDSEPAPKQTAAKPPSAKKAGTAVAKIEPRPAPPTNLLAVIASAAARSDVDVPKMKELLAMQREIEQAQDAAAFNRALLTAHAEMPPIIKDKDNLHTKSKYPSLENVSTSIDKIVRKHGFAMSFGTADSPLPKHYRVVCDLSHSYGTEDYPRGTTRRYHVDLESDAVGSQGKSNKTAIQGVMSTISYAKRNLKMMIFDLTIVDSDKDGAKVAKRQSQAGDAETQARASEDDLEASDPSVPKITGPQAKDLLAQINACGAGPEKFCKKYSIKAVHELPAHQYEEAVGACKNYAAANQNKAAKNG